MQLHQHARRRRPARLLRHPARRPGARRRPVPARALSAGRRRDARALARPAAIAELAFEILSLYIDDIPPPTCARSSTRTYTADVFGTPRDHAAEAARAAALFLEALSNGPTLAFKDMAMQLLGNLFEYELARRGETLNILGATSGDTGSAAEYAMRGKRGISVFMLSPHGRMSPFQQAQMFSLQDAEHPQHRDRRRVRRLPGHRQGGRRTTSTFKRAHRIGTVNSINWARAAWRRSSTTSPATSQRHARRNDEQVSASPCRRATSATSAPATSRA